MGGGFHECNFGVLWSHVSPKTVGTIILIVCVFFFLYSPENASADQIAGADPDYPDSTDPGRGA